MTIEERMDKIERAFGAQDDLVRELRDAVTVTAELEAAQGRIVKQHSAWLAELASSRTEWEARMQRFDERIANLVSAFGEFLWRDRN